MARAQFQKGQKVWVECVGAWAQIEQVQPVWAKGFDEPVRVTYDVGLGREFTANELMLAAERLAVTVDPGAHGLRRAGTGEDCWQYRPAVAGDPAGLIDWRRSARSDAAFVRERERQAPQSAALWVSGAAGMGWTGDPARPTKGDRGRLLALAQAGDMDISVLDEKPPGRQPITTIVLPDDRLAEVTPQQVQAAADRWLRPQSRAAVVYRAAQEQEEVA